MQANDEGGKEWCKKLLEYIALGASYKSESSVAYQRVLLSKAASVTWIEGSVSILLKSFTHLGHKALTLLSTT